MTAETKKRKKNRGGDAQLEMTPMIDVVFQLLIFFIVTLNQPTSCRSSTRSGRRAKRAPR